jgi:hypothetical protein
MLLNFLNEINILVIFIVIIIIIIIKEIFQKSSTQVSVGLKE